MIDHHRGESPMSDFSAAEAEVTELCRQLIRIDTQNWGGNRANPELPAAELIASWFAEVDLDSESVGSAPGGATLVTGVEATAPAAPALVSPGHPEAVPAATEDGSGDPCDAVVTHGRRWCR